MPRVGLKALLLAIALVWCCLYLLKPSPDLLSRVSATEKQQILLQYHTVDVKNLWQVQLASFQLPHPLLGPNAVALVSIFCWCNAAFRILLQDVRHEPDLRAVQNSTRWNAGYMKAVAAAAPPKYHAECMALQAVNKQHVRSIAVVGNGPLSDLQRQQIDASDVVMRFNELNTRCCHTQEEQHVD